MAAVSGMIGQYVTAHPDDDGFAHQGMVVGVRFEGEDSAFLTLADGTEIPLESVATIQAPDQAARGLVGQTITGVDRRDLAAPTPVSGQVTGVGFDGTGNVVLDLGGGSNVRLLDVISGIGDVSTAIASVF